MIETNENEVDKNTILDGARDFLAALEFIKAHENSSYLRYSNTSASSAMNLKEKNIKL